jgi:hypothetical protein
MGIRRRVFLTSHYGTGQGKCDTSPLRAAKVESRVQANCQNALQALRSGFDPTPHPQAPCRDRRGANAHVNTGAKNNRRTE